MKNNKNLFYKILKNGGLFLILIAITFYFIFKSLDINKVIKTISQINIFYIIPAIVCMCVYIFCEASNTKRNLIALGYNPSIFRCINYSVNGFFFSSITPSASGGQPMQAYQMCKDDIKISHATLVLLIELIFFQVVTIMFSLIGFFTQQSLLLRSIGSIKYLLVLGLILNIIALLFLLSAIFSYSAIRKVFDFVIKLIESLGYNKVKKIRDKVYSIINEYEECSLYITRNKTIILKTFLTTCIQIFAIHSIPYWVYRSFGFSGYSIFTFVGVQAVLFIAVCALPLPGAVGVSESGFLMLFKLLFPIRVLSEAMLISRGISFYLFLFLSGILLIILKIQNIKVKLTNE
ncbi:MULTISPECIES: lysylphosphatidylglycerol synthase transmembrane domain-containing protein [unclassified Romboutsia]|uniref:lysylphosphatidylglycerol synthase transmembrane domain-containing protein n=1 Tax=unclassified Romboutsia TaxID=2626894 RepID=UPI00082336A3|nr:MULTISPECIES: lysylphosphatidylglycerol synthase transmembrane domain-containing protein [unclassified Romboutsia]SCH87249.1 Uncharacterised protein family (UPF0104) [uncultured Clostridium sp.]